METSQYIQYINKFFTGISNGITSTLNGVNSPLPYYHKRYLQKQYSIDGTWNSISAANTQVMADIVAMDSSLPLKRRDTITKATGDIPKMGMELALREKQLTNLGILERTQGAEAQLIQAIFADTPKVITGVFERNEAIFLEALSTGVVAIPIAENTGTEIRMDYGVTRAGVTTVWSSTSSVPLTDMQAAQTTARAAGNTIIRFLMDRTAFNNMAKTDQVKNYHGFNLGFTGTAIAIPNFTQVNNMLQANFGFTIEIIDRSVRNEKNGVQTSYTPWTTGAVAGICTEQLGNLTWARLAEMDNPVAGVSYTTADDYILVSKFRENRPSLAEFTTSQALVIPVLTNTNQLYLIDSTTAAA